MLHQVVLIVIESVDKILKSDHLNIRSVMQQEELGTTIEYPAIHDMKQHDKVGATMMED